MINHHREPQVSRFRRVLNPFIRAVVGVGGLLASQGTTPVFSEGIKALNSDSKAESAMSTAPMTPAIRINTESLNPNKLSPVTKKVLADIAAAPSKQHDSSGSEVIIEPENINDPDSGIPQDLGNEAIEQVDNGLSIEGKPANNPASEAANTSAILSPEQNAKLDETSDFKVYYIGNGTLLEEDQPDNTKLRDFFKKTFEPMLASGVPEYRAAVNSIIDKSNRTDNKGDRRWSQWTTLMHLLNPGKANSTHPITLSRGVNEKFPRMVFLHIVGDVENLDQNPNSTHSIIAVHQVVETLNRRGEIVDPLVRGGKSALEANNQLGNPVTDMEIKLQVMETVFSTYLRERQNLVNLGVEDPPEVADMAQRWDNAKLIEDPVERDYQQMTLTKEWLGWRFPEPEIRKLALRRAQNASPS